MITKEFFTLDEAASFLSPPDGVRLSSFDLLRFCEDGRLPISFRYRGKLGFFGSYSVVALTKEILFPKPLHTVFFNGYLTSLSSCRLADEITGIRSLGPGRGREEFTIVTNTLRPHKVEILKVVDCDPSLAGGEQGAGFWGRLRDFDDGLDNLSVVPDDEWLIHITHMEAIKSHHDNLSQALANPALTARAKVLSNFPRFEPAGGDSITPMVWDICSDLMEQGQQKVTARSVMAILKSLASRSEKPHPLLGVVTGGVKFEYERGIEDELDAENLRHRIRKWRKAHPST